MSGAFKPQPMTSAERQRRHREKRKAELQVLRLNAPDAECERLRREATGLRAMNELLERKVTQQAQRIAGQAQPAAEADRLPALRQVLRSVLPRLPPTARHMVRTHLQQAGFIPWLDCD